MRTYIYNNNVIIKGNPNSLNSTTDNETKIFNNSEIAITCYTHSTFYVNTEVEYLFKKMNQG